MKQATAKRTASNAKKTAPVKKNPSRAAGNASRAPGSKALSPSSGNAPVRLDKIGLVILYVKSPPASLSFYRDVLGMKVLEESPEWVELDGGGVHLALHSHPSIPADRGNACSWVVFQVDDVHGIYRSLLGRGVTFLGEPKQVCGDEKKAGMSADLKDPDGNPLSIFGFVTKS